MLASNGVHISVCEQPQSCPHCGGPCHVQKTVRRHGKTIKHGQFEVRETVHVCAARCRHESGALVTRRAQCLTEQIMPGRVVGYDVMVFVGLERFLHQPHRQRDDIRDALRAVGIELSSGEVSNLARLFLEYLQELHHARTEQLRAALAQDGGWPLHVDATGEDGRGTLLVAYAGWKKWVLGAWKVPTERADVILACLREVVRQFGPPCAVMRDLGKAVTDAVNDLLGELKLDIPVLACHLHFLNDIGTDLLEPAHAQLCDVFRRTKVRPKARGLARELGRKLGNEIGQAREQVSAWQHQTEADHSIPKGRAGIATVRALAQWVLDFKADSAGQDFPFARPYLDLYVRCVTARRAVDAFQCSRPEDKKVRRTLKRLGRILAPVASDVPFRQIVRRLRARAQLLDELRAALRLVPKPRSGTNDNTSKDAPTAEQAATQLRDVRQQVEQLTQSLEQRRCERGTVKDSREAIDVVLRHIRDHGQYLWGHSICLPAEAGGGTRLVERTNNLLEGFFDVIKHNERRRSGRKNLTKDLEQLPAAAALAYNLSSPEYVNILCGTLERLPDAFAQLDFDKRQRALAGQQSTDDVSALAALQIESASLPTDDRRLIRAEDMKRRIVNAAKSRAPYLPRGRRSLG